MTRQHVQQTQFTVKQIVAAAILQSEQTVPTDSMAMTTRDILYSMPALPVDRAEHMIEQVQKNFTVSMLRGGNISQFNSRLAELLSDPDAKTDSVGILAYVPSVHRDLEKSNDIVMQTCNSCYQARVGDTLELTARVLSCWYVASYGFYTALLLDESGNVYNFSPKTSINEGTVVKLRGKVKAHKQDYYNHNVETTYLNYVKILGD